MTLSDDLERIIIKKIHAKYNKITINTIRDATINCPDLQFLLKCIRQRNWKRYKRDRQKAPFKTFMPTISCIDDILYKGDVIIVPETLTHTVTDQFHDMGHQGETNMASLIKQYFYYPSMYKQIDAITKACPDCQPLKCDKRQEPYGQRPLSSRPFSEIAIDWKTLPNGYYDLVILDIFTRMPEIAFTTSTSFDAIKPPLQRYFARFGGILILRSDGGPPMNSEQFQQFAEEEGFCHDIVTAYHPEANRESKDLCRK